MELFSKRNPNAAYIDEDTGYRIERPAKYSKPKPKPQPTRKSTPPPAKPAIFNRGSENDFIDYVAPTGKGKTVGKTAPTKSSPSPAVTRQVESAAERVERRTGAGLKDMSEGGGNRVRIGNRDFREDDPAIQKILDADRASRPDQKFKDIRGGGGIDPNSDPLSPTRMVRRGPSTGTATSPTSRQETTETTETIPRTPADFGAFMNKLQTTYGIQFNFNEQDRGGSQSNALPGTKAAGAGDAVIEMIDGKRLDTPMTINAYNEKYGNDNVGATVAQGVQAGESPVADRGDRVRQVSFGEGENGAMFDNSYGDYDDDNRDGGGLSARSRAFLDYDGKGGSAMALRAAEAAQGTIRQNGVTYAMTPDGEATALTPEGSDILRRDGNAHAQQYLADYSYVPGSPTETEPKDVMKPEPASTSQTQSNIGPVADVDEYGRILKATQGMEGMGPLADDNTYGLYLDGREKMMRR